ncbi:MAG: hypothetical protein R3C68_13355 [Myxococcota bacterium]
MKKETAPRKLSDKEMEVAKGGSTFSKLSTFNVTSAFSTPSIGSALNPAAETVMCGGQTRAMVVDFDPVRRF